MAAGVGDSGDGVGSAVAIEVALQANGHAANAFAGVRVAVVVQINEDGITDGTRAKLAEVVAGAGLVLRERDGGKHIIGQGATGAADGIGAVRVTIGLGFGDRVVARTQVGEAVTAVGRRLN